ncbi:sensor histidine kinase [Hyunsoonleella rubra]
MCSFGQINCNCSIGSYLEKIELLNTRDSLEVFELSAELKKTKLEVCKFKALEIEFNYFITQLNEEKAFAVLNELEDYLGRINCESDLKFNIYINKAKYFKLHNNYEKLSEFAFKALKEAEYLKDSNKEIEAIKQIVYLFTRMDEDDKNWQYIKRAEKLIFKQSNPIRSVKNFRWLAFEYETKYTRTKRKPLLDSLFIFANHSKKGAKKYNIFDELALSYRALEAYSYHKGNAKNALKYIDSAIFYAKKIKGKKNLSGLYISKAWDHLDWGEKELAVKWMDTSFAYDTKDDIAGFMMHHLDATDLYEQAGRLDKALSSYQIHSRIKDSIFNTERTQVINELETKYKTELKDAKIKRLNVLLVITLLIIVSILLAGSVIQLKRTRKKNKILKRAIEEQERLEKELSDVRGEIAQDFHDDLGNKLARISLLSSLISGEVSIKSPNIKSKIKQINEDANGLYKGTRDFIFSLKSNSDYLEEVVTYLSDFGGDIFNKTEIKFTVEKHISTNVKLPYYWSKQIVFIFKEALTNAMKHSNCHTVKLSFGYQGYQLSIRCEDDGIGILESDLQSLNGLSHMKTRGIKIGCELLINSNIGEGTAVILKGNLKEDII